MTDHERDRAFRYAFRRYDLLGPASLAQACDRLKFKITKATDMAPETFDELLEDLITENGWSQAKAMAYFEVIDIEDRM